MADHLILTIRLRGPFGASTMLPLWEKMLRLFPYSRLATQPSVLRVQPVDYAEPLAWEQAFPPPVDAAVVAACAAEFLNEDCLYELETWWDLWQFDGEWKLAPAPVSLECVGPAFLGAGGEHLRVRFGLADQFLPDPGLPNYAVIAKSNLQGLIRLVHELDEALPVDSRAIEDEEGVGLADRLEFLSAGTPPE